MGCQCEGRSPSAPSTLSKTELLWDPELRGFGVRARAGGGKFYVLKFRVGGKQRWHTIGRHGSPWTPEQARKEARRILGELTIGKSPRGEARATVADAVEGFIEAHCRHLRSGNQTACLLRKDVVGRWGSRRVRIDRAPRRRGAATRSTRRRPDEARLHREPGARRARPLLQVGNQRGDDPLARKSGRRHGTAAGRDKARARIVSTAGLFGVTAIYLRDRQEEAKRAAMSVWDRRLRDILGASPETPT